MIYGVVDDDVSFILMCAKEWNLSPIKTNSPEFTYDGILRKVAIAEDFGCVETVIFSECNKSNPNTTGTYMEYSGILSLKNLVME